MSVITDIKVQTKDKKRCNVFVDGEFSFALYIETAMKHGLKKDLAIDQSFINQILEEDSILYAFSLGLKYVSRSLKTKKQVVTYLLNKGFNEKITYIVIDKLKEYNYINDEEYAKRYLEIRSSVEGKRLSDYKLMMKGIKKSDIESAREDFDDNSKESAKRIAEKKLKNREITKENLSKVYRYIIGKGFSYEDAEYAISCFKETD